MRPVEGTITDPRSDYLLGNAPVSPSEKLTLNGYQEEAAKTAIYPRVYTEAQVAAMLKEILDETQLVYHEDLDGARLDGPRLDTYIALKLDKFETDFSRLVYPVLGLLGETGEIANKLKKVARDGKGMQTDEQSAEIVKEIGDVQWYVAAIATELRAKLGTIAGGNLIKLASRQARNVLGGSGDNR